MKKSYIISFIIGCVSILCSCSTMYYVNKNEKFTRSKASQIAAEHGNAFFVEYGIATWSYLWFYTDSTVVLNKLVNGKMTHTQQYPSINRDFDLKAITNDSIKALYNDVERHTPTVLDSGLIEFIITNQGKELEAAYVVDVEKFTNQQYDHPLLNEIARILKTYSLLSGEIWP